jgi:hypothetical protein
MNILYTHYKNNKPYRILNAGKMQINQEWVDCVVYQDIKSLEVYVREEQSFDECFSAE